MRISFRLIASLSALSVAACAPTYDPAKGPPSAAKIVDNIRADEVHWNADWKSGDLNRIVGHYAADAVVMAPGALRLEGKDSIKAGIAAALQDASHSLTFASDKIEVAKSGDLAVSRGTFNETTGEITVKGSFVTVYRPGVDGVWKAVWDINTPGPVAAMPVIGKQ